MIARYAVDARKAGRVTQRYESQNISVTSYLIDCNAVSIMWVNYDGSKGSLIKKLPTTTSYEISDEYYAISYEYEISDEVMMINILWMNL